LYALKGNKTREFWRYAPAPVVVPAGDWAGLPPAVERAGPQPGGQQTDIENPICEGYFASRPRWRPDGGAVCYSREDEAGWLQVYMVPTNPPGPEVRLTLEPTDHEAPVFSPNGQWVAFAMLDTVTDCYQIAKVPAIPMPSPAIVLTSDPFDHEYPEWNFTSNWLVYQKDDFTSYAQLWRVPANGGPEQPLTGDAADHEWPSYLTPNEVVFQRGAAGDYEHIWKLNLMTMEQMPLTTGGYEHENPCPAYFGTSVAYQGMDPSGTWQIGLVSSNGGGEHFLTNEQCFDLEEPDWSADLNSIFCVRWVGFGREIGRVDATMGGYVPCTDGSAIRDNPDTYWHPDLGWNFVIYERENLGLFGDGGSDDPRRKPRPGTGIFLTRARRAEGGPMTAGLTGVALHQALPNPARGRVNIRWQVPQETDVSLTVYDASGRLVRTLAQGRTRPGEYTSVWDGTDSQGQSVAAGVYFYSLSTGSDLLRRKVVLAE
jgi:hypothetical protein